MRKLKRYFVISDLENYTALAAAALHRALRDATSDSTRLTADARFWLLYGDGAHMAGLLGIETEIREFVEGLPNIAGQNGALQILEFSRLIDWSFSDE